MSSSHWRAMSKLAPLRNAIKWRASPLDPTRRLPSRSLSTTEANDQPEGSTVDPFLRPPQEGMVFAKLTGVGRNTLKTDVIHFFDGCNLSPEDIKVDYNRNRAFAPLGMMVQFPSASSFDMAIRQTIRKGRLYKLDKIDRSQWDLMTSYDGRAVLLQGIPRNALQEDIERFLSGLNFDSSTFQFFNTPGMPEPVRLALVQFATPIDAMTASYMKNRSFCLNSPITVRVLQ